MIWKTEQRKLHEIADRKPNEKNESAIRDLQDNVKHTNLHIIGGPSRGRKTKED